MRNGLLKIIMGMVLCLLVFSSCSKKNTNTNEILRVGIQAGPMSLDPRIATDAEGMKITALMFDGLMRRNEKLEMVPSLATKYEQLSPTEYKFYLRQGVKFHDGSIFSSKDVVYTYSSIMSGEVKTALKGAFNRIELIRAIDENTVYIKLKEPYAPFLTLLNWGIVPITAREKGDTFAQSPIGTGPYKLVKYTPEIGIKLTANENYFAEAPKVKNLTLEIIKDNNIRALKLMKGEIDLVQNSIPTVMLKKLLEDKKLAMISDTGIIIAYIGLNLQDPILSHKKVRQALYYGINRDEIIKHRWEGYAQKASSLLSPSNWAFDSKLKGYDYNPEKAKALLDQAGFKDPDGDKGQMRFSVIYKTSTSKDRIAIANLIANQLRKIGVNLIVESYEWGKFFSDVKKRKFSSLFLVVGWFNRT